MKRLIFCSFEVGGLPFQMADLLNRQGRSTFYASVARTQTDAFNTTRHHRQGAAPEWDLSAEFARRGAPDIVAGLKALNERHGPLACLATGGDAHLLAEAGIAYAYWSYGSDLDQSCFAPVWPAGYPLWKRAVLWPRFLARVRGPARQSLRLAQSVWIAGYQKPALDRIAPGANLTFLPHLMPVRPWEQVLRDNSTARQRVAERIGPEPFVFSAARHVWSGTLKDHADRKGNDLMLRAFAAHSSGSPTGPERLVLVRKGPDVADTAALAGALGLGDRIVWVDEMSRAELNEFYAAARLCLGQFGTPVLTYAALEPLAHGTPAASLFSTGPGVPWYASPPPILNTGDPALLGQHITQLLLDPEARDRQGREGWQWVAEHCSEERFATAFDEMFPLAATGDETA